MNHEEINSIENIMRKAEEIRDAKKVLEYEIELSIVFIDMAGSTSYKEEHEIIDWLPRLCEFLRRCTLAVNNSGGRIVKYIGDEAMGIFSGARSVKQAEAAVMNLRSDPPCWDAIEIPMKIAADHGPVALLKFDQQLYADPQGSTCDRCARLAAVAKAGSFVCSEHFYKRSSQRTWELIGDLELRGLKEKVAVYQNVTDEIKLELEVLRKAALPQGVLIEKLEALEAEKHGLKEKLENCRNMLRKRGKG